MRTLRNASFALLVLLCAWGVGEQRVQAAEPWCEPIENTLTAFILSENGGFTEQEAEETCQDIQGGSAMCQSICLDVCHESTANAPGYCDYYPEAGEWGVDIQCPCVWDIEG
jgi:hypothetical protein